MTATRTEEIVLSGPPRSISGFVPVSVERGTMAPVSVSVNGQSTVYRAVLRPFGAGTSEIRLQLPAETPPGTYSGEATFDGKPRRVVVDVDPVMRLRVRPKYSKVSGEATSSVNFEFTVVNSGNVVFDVPAADTLDLDDQEAQDRALGKTLRAPLTQGEHRVDRFFDELRRSHGGEARVAVRSGAGPLGPGESRALTCTLDVPASAESGRSYSGPWRLGNTAHVIVADITKSERPNGQTK